MIFCVFPFIFLFLSSAGRALKTGILIHWHIGVGGHNYHTMWAAVKGDFLTLLRTACRWWHRWGLLFSICLFFLQEMIRIFLEDSQGSVCSLWPLKVVQSLRDKWQRLTIADWTFWRAGSLTAMAKAAAPAFLGHLSLKCSLSLITRGDSWRLGAEEQHDQTRLKGTSGCCVEKLWGGWGQSEGDQLEAFEVIGEKMVALTRLLPLGSCVEMAEFWVYSEGRGGRF